MTEPRLQEKSSRMGRDIGSPIHVIQMVIATLLLIASSVLLIQGMYLLGVLALLVGMVVSLVNFRFR